MSVYRTIGPLVFFPTDILNLNSLLVKQQIDNSSLGAVTGEN